MSLEQVAEILGRAAGQTPMAAEDLRARLQTIMTPSTSEGFFADAVVLVEGEGDRAAILGCAAAMGWDFDSKGIAVVPSGGKRNLDRPLVIFRELGIPTYVVWDGDFGRRDARAEENRHLLALLGAPAEDWPEAATAAFTCFKVKLEDTLRREIGAAEYDGLVAESMAGLGIEKKEHAMKRPAVFRCLVERADRAGIALPTLQAVVRAVVALRG